MLTKPGRRVSVTAPVELTHGQAAVIDGLVGFVFKSEQIDRWTLPADAATIEAGERCVISIGDEHEIELVAPFAAAAVGSLLYIDPDDNSVDDAGAVGDLPLGVVVDVDSIRTPDVALVNCNALNAFMAVPAP